MVFNSILGFGDQTFTTIVLLLSAAITSHYVHGWGTRKGRDLFIVLVLLLILAVQYTHLIRAATYIPANRFYVWNDALHRDDCLESSKGGKRPQDSKRSFDYNPCFCYVNATCTIKTSGISYVMNETTTCPTDDSAECTSPDGIKVELYVPFKRNCMGGQPSRCTKLSPCDPCERAQLPEWQGRCRTCSTDNLGDCGFIEGKGPYCLVERGSKEIEPCRRCCTEPEPLFINGTCY